MLELCNNCLENLSSGCPRRGGKNLRRAGSSLKRGGNPFGRCGNPSRGGGHHSFEGNDNCLEEWRRWQHP